MKGLNETQVLNAFPFSLTRSASKWYYTLDIGNVKGWTELLNAFLTQFSFNKMIDITLRDLETTKQKEEETFSEYLVRWREKASKMINCLGEKDQVNIMMKGLLPIYFNRMLSAPIMNFEQLCDCGTRIEDAMENGKIERNEGRATSKKTYGQTSKNTPQTNVSAVYQTPIPSPYPYQYSNPSRQVQTLRSRRHFDPAPLSKIYEHFLQKGHLKPLNPTPTPNPIPKGWNFNLHCLYHKKSGHSTDKCFHLKNDIQDLIDRDIIPKPNSPNMPNIHQNPLPNYQRVPPPNQLKFIEEEEFIFVIADEVWTDFYKSANEDSYHSTRIGKHFKPPHSEAEHPGEEKTLKGRALI
jgi:hypothetical protein